MLDALFLINVSNFAETNCCPLSDTTCSRRPYHEKNSLNTSIVLCDIVDFIIFTSGHFECASMTIRNMWLLKNGPTKSICNLFHGWAGQIQGWSGAIGGLFLTS